MNWHMRKTLKTYKITKPLVFKQKEGVFYLKTEVLKSKLLSSSTLFNPKSSVK